MVKITMKSGDIDKLLVFIKELEKEMCLKEIKYSLIKLNYTYLLNIEFTLNDTVIESLTNKYNDSLNIINLEGVIYLICQYDYLIFRYTLTDIITTLKNGYTDNNISNTVYDTLDEIDMLYNTCLATTFQKGGDINVIY